MWGIKLSPGLFAWYTYPPAVCKIPDIYEGREGSENLVCKGMWWVIHYKPPAPKARGGTPYKITNDECEP